MNWKVFFFISLPFILLGCTAYRYLYLPNQKEELRSGNLPQADEEIQRDFPKINGRKR
jgi:hypothetical protein